MMKKIILLAITILPIVSIQAQHDVFINAGLAIRGYDPVAYFKEHKAIKGKQELAYVWKEATWLFSSEQNLNDFKKAPEQYAPQYGGYCAYGTSEGHKAPTDPEAWTIANGKLFLNYSKDVRNIWLKDQQACIQKANENWPKIKNDHD
jgi:YHS domain-containing protein